MIKIKSNFRQIVGVFMPVFSIVLLLASAGWSQSLADYFSVDDIENAARLKSYHALGNMKMAGLKGTTEILFKAPDKIRVTLDLGEFKVVQVFDGRAAFMRDQNGMVLEMTGSDRKSLVNTAYYIGSSYLLDNRMGGTTVLSGDTLINGCDYLIFTAVPEQGDSLWLFYNRDSARIDIALERVDDILAYTFYMDYRDVDGFNMPFRYRVESDVEQLNSIIDIQEIEINCPVDDSAFVLREIPFARYSFPGDADSVVTDFIFHKGHIYLKASVNGGRAVFFILDSGAGINTLDRGYAEELGIEFAGDFATKGVSGYESAAVTPVDSIRIGDISLYNQTFGVVNVSDFIPLKQDQQFGGLLGYDFLALMPVRVDYVRKKLIIYNPEKFVPPNSEFALDFDFAMKIPVITAVIDSVEGRFMVDLGNSLGLILHKSFVDRHNLIDGFSDIKELRSSIGGIGGSASSFGATAGSMRLGSAKLRNIPILVAESKGGIIKSREVDGNIGNFMLQDFSVILDYSNKKIYIMPADK